MLTGLDPTIAAGPDTTKPIVLRSLKDQVAPMLQVIFKNSRDWANPIWLEKGNFYAFVQPNLGR